MVFASVARVFNPCRSARVTLQGTGWKPVLQKTVAIGIVFTATASFAQKTCNPISDAILECQFPDGAIARTRGERHKLDCFVTSYCFGGFALAKAYEQTHQ